MQNTITTSRSKIKIWQNFTLSRAVAPYVFVAPVFILFCLFMVYPIVYSFILSLQTNRGGELAWNGFNNYTRLLGDELFRTALFNTFIVLIIQVPIMLSLAILLAIALNSSSLKGKGF